MRTIVLEDRSSKKPIFIFVLIIIMAASAVYLMITGRGGYQKIEMPSGEAAPSGQAVAQPSGSLTERVGKHILITEKEAPRVYTINNIDLVRQKNPDFYKDAQQGDKVLIWKDRAIIYSEQIDRIVAVATATPLVRLSEEDPSEQGDETSSALSIDQLRASTTIEIRNGSRKNGEAGKLKQTLTEAGFVVTKIGDAGAVYVGTQIIDLTGGGAMPIVEALLEPTNGSVTSTVPVTERPSEANILILIGR